MQTVGTLKFFSSDFYFKDTMKFTLEFLLQVCILSTCLGWITNGKQTFLEVLLNNKLHELWTKLKAFENDSLTARIVGGHVARSGEFPYMVALKSRNGKLLCGGSLLSAQHVLTAAHCIQGVHPSMIRVLLGTQQLSNARGGVERGVTQFWTNAGFDFNAFDWDVAVLRLSASVTLSANIQPVCLPSSDSHRDYVGRHATVIGWGRRRESDRVSSDQLRKVNVPVVNSRRCQRSYRYFRAITERMICAGFRRGGRDSCQGDSGGPMVIRSGSRVMQIGIVSWGNGCARPSYYGVYTKISQVVSWIKRFATVQECS